MNLRYLWLCLLTAVAIASISVVFYWPRLRLPDSADFQLFAASHPFEQYDYIYKNKFWFEKPQKVSIVIFVSNNKTRSEASTYTVNECSCRQGTVSLTCSDALLGAVTEPFYRFGCVSYFLTHPKTILLSYVQ